MKHTLIALVQDRPGVLHRAVSLFRRRGFNIESLAVGHCEIPGVSRMTVVVDVQDVDQVIKQFNRLIEVLAVNDVTADPTVERETVLAKVTAPTGHLAELVAIANAAGARIADVSAATMIIELTDAPGKVDDFVALVQPFGIQELVRTGCVAMVRGATTRRGTAPAPDNDWHSSAAQEQPCTMPSPFQWQADGVTGDAAA